MLRFALNGKLIDGQVDIEVKTTPSPAPEETDEKVDEAMDVQQEAVAETRSDEHSAAIEKMDEDTGGGQFEEGCGDKTEDKTSPDEDDEKVVAKKMDKNVGKDIKKEDRPTLPPPISAALFPAVLTKNVRLEVNLGQLEVDPLPGFEDYVFPTKTSEDWAGRERAPLPPFERRECQFILMVGLPASGKSYWVSNHIRQYPERHYNVLGTKDVLARMLACAPPPPPETEPPGTITRDNKENQPKLKETASTVDSEKTPLPATVSEVSDKKTTDDKSNESQKELQIVNKNYPKEDCDGEKKKGEDDDAQNDKDVKKETSAETFDGSSKKPDVTPKAMSPREKWLKALADKAVTAVSRLIDAASRRNRLVVS